MLKIFALKAAMILSSALQEHLMQVAIQTTTTRVAIFRSQAKRSGLIMVRGSMQPVSEVAVKFLLAATTKARTMMFETHGERMLAKMLYLMQVLCNVVTAAKSSYGPTILRITSGQSRQKALAEKAMAVLQKFRVKSI